MLDARFAENHYVEKSEQKLIVTKDTHNENILDLLLGNYTKNILESIKIDPKSTLQLCVELRIPISTVYRITRKLYDYGLVRRTYTINDAGKRVSMYKFREIKHDHDS